MAGAEALLAFASSPATSSPSLAPGRLGALFATRDEPGGLRLAGIR
jgi:hypothetical protein